MNLLQEKILEIKKQKNALLLVHNYQVPEIQEIADFLGDSLELCREAQRAKDVDMIVFCGVDFMAETAKVLNPDKKVVIPSAKAICPMAGMLSMDVLLEAKKKHPDAPVVLYVNTLAEAKAEATVTCTSANADKIVKQLGAKQVIFGPDKNLAYFVRKRVPGVEIIDVPADGHCRVHRFIGNGDEAIELKKQHPGSEVWAHPECEPEFQERADYVLSTGGMVKRAKETDAKMIIVGTEEGLIDRLQRENPEKIFLPAKKYAVCGAMKRITLENLFMAIVNEEPVVEVQAEIADRARLAIERMLEMS
ncbi:quinolinate synthase NadA [Candidatus Bathyarchaeota archaeon]|jgi:quinolinate synthase|nr:MAG: quinolinate synthase NadA [Candidatus Bathyarchaeota archaeon]